MKIVSKFKIFGTLFFGTALGNGLHGFKIEQALAQPMSTPKFVHRAVLVLVKT